MAEPADTGATAATSNGGKPAVLIVGGLGIPVPIPLSPILPILSSDPPAVLREIWRLTADLAGYIGRFLALHIHRNHLAAELRLVDKVLPQLARLPPEFAEACAQGKFMQADASREREHPFLQQRACRRGGGNGGAHAGASARSG